MRNYRELIFRVLSKDFPHIIIVDDPNAQIDSVIESEVASWYPSYLAVDAKNYYMYMPFHNDDYVYEDEFMNECIES